MRSKEQMIEILAKRKMAGKIADSTWGDLVSGIQMASPAERNKLLALIKNNQLKKVGEFLKQALTNDAKVRAKAAVETMLADDSISLTELDELL